MTSEDPIPLDQDPMQSWIGVAHSGGLCTLGASLSGDLSDCEWVSVAVLWVKVA